MHTFDFNIAISYHDKRLYTFNDKVEAIRSDMKKHVNVVKEAHTLNQTNIEENAMNSREKMKMK